MLALTELQQKRGKSLPKCCEEAKSLEAPVPSSLAPGLNNPKNPLSLDWELQSHYLEFFSFPSEVGEKRFQNLVITYKTDQLFSFSDCVLVSKRFLKILFSQFLNFTIPKWWNNWFLEVRKATVSVKEQAINYTEVTTVIGLKTD